MNVLLGIVIALAIVVMAGGILLKFLEGLIEFLGVVVPAIGASLRRLATIPLAWWKCTRLMIFIPPELDVGASPLPTTDTELESLLSWQPTAPEPYSAQQVTYESRLTAIYSQDAAHSNQMFIEALSMLRDASPAADTILASFPVATTYPIPAPPVLPEIKPFPTQITPWVIKIAEPEIKLPTLPRFLKRLSKLNEWLLELHEPQIAQYRNAVRRREELLQAVASRNQRLAEALQKNQEMYAQLSNERRRLNDRRQATYAACRAQYEAAAKKENAIVDGWRMRCAQPAGAGLVARAELALHIIKWPDCMPRHWDIRFDDESGILIIEHQFPDIGAIEWVKSVELKLFISKKPANKTEQKRANTQLYPTLCLRLAVEAIRVDLEGIIRAVTINGWAIYREKSTGHDRRAYCASLFATREQVLGLQLDRLDPEAAFRGLKGIASTHSLELVPIAPILKLNMDDPRFVDAREVLGKLQPSENLAAMGWEDFEHLVRELFEKAFASTGAEVKVTQASRDQGVDAVIFDPDPLRGGKLVVQAKRYTNTVDVSAVRDLYGAIINEGATKGILVSTSHFGPEAYAFAKDKPITLINGEELLGILVQHGYTFRIDLAEARALANNLR